MGGKKLRPGPEVFLVFKSQWDHHSFSISVMAFPYGPQRVERREKVFPKEMKEAYELGASLLN